MGEVIPFPDRFRSLEPALVDDAGFAMQLYTLSYRLDDRTWSFTVWAYSLDDAEARVKAIRRCLTLDGVVVAVIQARGLIDS